MRGYRGIYRALIVCAFWAGLAATSATRAGDLREQFNTRSLDAANHIDAAIKLEQARKPADANKEIDLALKSDPACTMSYFWKALIVGDMGDVDQSIEWYHKCINLHPSGSDNIVTEAETNLGIVFGKLQRYQESGYWLSRAIVDDEDNHAHAQGKAYRNLAVTLRERGEHLSAGLTAVLGNEVDPTLVSEKMVVEMLQGAEGQEVARVLTLEDGNETHAPTTAPALSPRQTKTQLTKLVLGGDPIAEQITQLLPDPQGRYVLAIARGQDHYYVISPARDPTSLTGKAVTAPGPLSAACLIGQKLFLATGAPDAPAKLDEVDVTSGKSLRSFNLGGPVDSLAAFPSRNTAFVSSKDTIFRVDLTTGKIASTEMPGQSLTADPTQRFLYTRMKDPPTANVRTAIINGRPVVIRSGRMDWNQTVLMKYYVGWHKLMPAAMRLNAAANGSDVVTSPDGQYVSLPGGGGWRPVVPAPGAGTGYVIPVFRADDVGQVLASFSVDAYPVGAAYNPVTNQFLGVRKDDAKVYDLGQPSAAAAETLKGAFSGACAWSGDGRHLFLAQQKAGLSAYSNALSPQETARAAVWFKSITPAPPYGRATTRPAAVASSAVKSIDALKTFAPSSDPAAVRQALRNALDHGSTDRPVLWRQYEPYNASEAGRGLPAVLNAKLEAGLRIYQIKKLMEKDPAKTPCRYFLAVALLESGQTDAAHATLLETLHADAGRTELSLAALNNLAGMCSSAGNDLQAVDCLAWSLLIDKAHAHTIDLLAPLLAKLQWTEDARRVAALKTSTGTGAAVTGLPALGAPPAGKAMTADELYQACAASVVLIRSGASSGTGVCVGRTGVIVTSRHVIANADAIAVYPFSVENGKARRLARATARVLFIDEEDDLAILSVENAPPTLTPLPVATASPGAGKTVYALGNPGMGPQTLDLSLSQGIVSTANRSVDGHSYIQHTASVNPGNSGGPILNDNGQVVGIVCLKAHLEGVSFATPVEKVRAIFPKSAARP